MANRQVVKAYTFSVVARTITLTDFTAAQPVTLDRLALIVDVTTNRILYNFADSTVATATVTANNVITLSVLQGGEANGDKLHIAYTNALGDPAYDASPAQNVTKQTNETSTILAGNATFNGASQDTGNNTAAGAGWSKFRVLAFSDVAGTINIQQSRDGVTWRTTLTQAVLAATGTVAESIITRRYVRASYTNGAAGQATFELDSVLVAV